MNVRSLFLGLGAAGLAVGGSVAAMKIFGPQDPDDAVVQDRPKTPSAHEEAPPIPVTKPRVSVDDAKLAAALASSFGARDVPLHEWQLPTSTDAPKGVALIVHGGAWFGVGPGALRSMDGEVQRWRDRGWATLNVDYRPGGDSYEDVLAFYDALRSAQGPDVPVAVIGASAGAHLAMILGANRQDVDLIVSEAGPTHIPSIGGNGFADSVRVAGYNAFGDKAEGTMSPVNVANQITSPLLLAHASNDGIVPIDQLDKMENAHGGATIARMEPGEIPWVHSGVSLDSFNHFVAQEDGLASKIELGA